MKWALLRENPWKAATLGLGGIVLVALLITLPAAHYVLAHIHLLPGFDRLVAEGKHRRPVDSLVKAFERAAIWRAPSPQAAPDSLVDQYSLRISTKKVAQIDEDLLYFERHWDKMPHEELSDKRRWHRIGFAAAEAQSKAKISLRGTRGHWMHPKKSWKLKFPSSAPYRTMAQTHLIIPYDRGWVADHLFNRLAKRRGLMTLKDGFSVLYINGVHQGLYYQIEHPSEYLLARHQRQKGPLLRHERDGQFASYTAVPPAQTEYVQEFLDQLHSGALNPAQIRAGVAVEKYLALIAIARLFGTDHWSLNSPDNVRLYFDPSQGRLEPIPWDTFCYPYQLRFPGEGLDPRSSDPLSRALLQEPDLQYQRNRLLWDLVGPGFAAVLEEYDRIAAHIVPHVQTDLMKNYSSSYALWEIRHRYRQHLVDNAAFFRALLERNQVSLQLVQHQQETEVQLVNLGLAPLEWVALKAGNTILPAEVKSGLLKSYRTEGLQVQGRQQVFSLQTEKELPQGLKVRLRNGVTGQEFEVDAPLLKTSDRPVALSGAGQSIEGLKKTATGWRLGPGKISLQHTLVLAPGQALSIAAGTDLRLERGVSLLARGPVTALGQTDRPITISLADSASVLAISDAADTSRFTHVHLRGGQDAQIEGIFATGALSFLRSPARIQHCKFENSTAEDALNAKHTHLEVEDSFFSANASDALDADWCTGHIRYTWFSASGGDHIDLSGAEMEISANVLLGATDKGISVGERAKPKIVDNIIANDSTGVAVKDQSLALLQNNALIGNKVGLRLYIKKANFAPPQAALDSCLFVENEKDWETVQGQLSGTETNALGGKRAAAMLEKLPSWRQQPPPPGALSQVCKTALAESDIVWEDEYE